MTTASTDLDLAGTILVAINRALGGHDRLALIHRGAGGNEGDRGQGLRSVRPGLYC